METKFADQPGLVIRISKTTYYVKVHFKLQAQETMSDKIVHMLRNEVRQSPKL
ncbi:MAG: transposon-encoded TnpW family protein [Eubacteriaceae bacterium]|nr:transposon-encoded TnpW family protein [Eubacteriaceae bacterium]